MDIELLHELPEGKRRQWVQLLERCGLEPDAGAQTTALIWEGDRLIAAGSRQDSILKCIAVDPAHQGENLAATLLTQLRQDAFSQGLRHLFLYTKPRNRMMFSSLFFYPVAQSEQVLLMESRKNGIRDFVRNLQAPQTEGVIGAAVMNCNPFTLGHRYLIETAARECDWLYVFVLSEDKSLFPAADRLALVQAGTAELPNVTVQPTGPYLISSATFPTYFLKEQDSAAEAHCGLDLEIFTRYFVPRLGITRRYVGTEPLSPVTSRYNEALARLLPSRGVELRLLPRLEQSGEPISASRVRALLQAGEKEKLQALLPETTLRYLEERGLMKEKRILL